MCRLRVGDGAMGYVAGLVCSEKSGRGVPALLEFSDPPSAT